MNTKMNTNRTHEETQFIRTAERNLNRNARRIGRVLMPENEARVEFADFDPCRAAQVVARVYWPGIQNCKPQIFCWAICEGDSL